MDKKTGTATRPDPQTKPPATRLVDFSKLTPPTGGSNVKPPPEKVIVIIIKEGDLKC